MKGFTDAAKKFLSRLLAANFILPTEASHYDGKPLKCVEISLSADSAVLFFRFLSLFSVSEAVSPSKIAPPFNDSRQSLKGLNGAGAEPCTGSDKKYLTAAQAAISN